MLGCPILGARLTLLIAPLRRGFLFAGGTLGLLVPLAARSRAYQPAKTLGAAAAATAKEGARGVGLEVGDDVFAEIGPEYERVRPIAAGHGVVATPPDQPVGVDAASQGVIAISAIEHRRTVAGRERVAFVGAREVDHTRVGDGDRVMDYATGQSSRGFGRARKWAFIAGPPGGQICTDKHS